MEGSSPPTSRQEPPMSEKPISPLRQRMLDDMSVRRFTPDTQRDYIRAVKKLAAFLGRSPDTATAEDLRGRNIPDPHRRAPFPLVIGRQHLRSAGQRAATPFH